MKSQPKPFKGCTLTRKELKDDGKKLNDFCDNCFDCGVECKVRWHPSEMEGNKKKLIQSVYLIF